MISNWSSQWTEKSLMNHLQVLALLHHNSMLFFLQIYELFYYYYTNLYLLTLWNFSVRAVNMLTFLFWSRRSSDMSHIHLKVQSSQSYLPLGVLVLPRSCGSTARMTRNLTTLATSFTSDADALGNVANFSRLMNCSSEERVAKPSEAVSKKRRKINISLFILQWRILKFSLAGWVVRYLLY